MSFGFSIGDLITVTRLAWDTYSALKDAPKDLQGFASEVHSLYTALVCLRDEGSSPSSILQYAPPQKIAGLKDVIENCEHSLIGLQNRAKRVCLLQPKQKVQFWHEFKLAFKDKQGPRDRIAIHTASINMFLSSLTNGSLGRLELLLRNALQSSLSGFSTSSTTPRGLGNYTENTWNDIGQDLLMEGISEKHFGTFQNEIKAYMRYLVHGGTPLSETNFHHGSTTGRHHDDERIFVTGDLFSVRSEAGRHQHSSRTGAASQPQFINVLVGDGSPERGHCYDLRRERRSASASSEEDTRYREHHRRSWKRRSELDEELILKLDKLKFVEKLEADCEYEKKMKRQSELDEDLVLKLDKLKPLERQEAARQREEKLKKELKIQKAWELYEREQKAKKERELQKEKEKRENGKEDRRFEERFKVQFMQAGYTEEQAEAVLHKKVAERQKKQTNTMAVDLSRPTWIKVKREWLVPETLDHYYLPWEWDKDSEYIVVKQYIDQEMLDRLFQHTRMLKERKMIAGPIEQDTVTTLKVRDRTKDQMYLVRKKRKSPGHDIYLDLPGEWDNTLEYIGEDMTTTNHPRVSRVQETKRETVDVHDLVYSFDDLFPIIGYGLAA